MKSFKITKFLRNSIFALAVRHGLTLAIPFLIMGSFALLLNNFPFEPYQDFLASFLGGSFSGLMAGIYEITLGSLALVLILTISLSYGRLTGNDAVFLYPVISLVSYLAFCGGLSKQAEYIFGAEWVFTAMCMTMLSCILFEKGIMLGRRFRKLHTTGAEYLYNLAMNSLTPSIIIILIFASTGFAVRTIWHSTNITNFGSYLFLQLFHHIGGNLPGILFYVLMTHVLWFFGIHGTNTLEAVSQRLFEHNIELNQAMILAGKEPTQVFSKTFLDTFVFLGGCGSALCLVLALGICARKSHNRKMALVALPSALFNISEIVIFGFPVILNPVMLIPFLLSPLILVLTSALAMYTGIVPVAARSMEWTAPVFISGYQATGSISGSILQLVNIIIGVLIYIPFVKWSEKAQAEEFMTAVKHMEDDMALGEKQGVMPQYLKHGYRDNYYAKTLAMDLENAIHRDHLQLFYQPQIKEDGTIHGMEALLRWDHPVVGYIAPPVLIGLAYESGILNELSSYLLEKACHDAQRMRETAENDFCLSVNISPKQLETMDFLDHALEIVKEHAPKGVHIALEITERTLLVTSDMLMQKIQLLKQSGIEFSLDDFGMGHSSLLLLQENLFDEVKLDGTLVKKLLSNDRSRNIISSIIKMSDDLHFRVVAEYVETLELKQVLAELGCTIYQGYYYSRPLCLTDSLQYLAAPETGRIDHQMKG